MHVAATTIDIKTYATKTQHYTREARSLEEDLPETIFEHFSTGIAGLITDSLKGHRQRAHFPACLFSGVLYLLLGESQLYLLCFRHAAPPESAEKGNLSRFPAIEI